MLQKMQNFFFLNKQIWISCKNFKNLKTLNFPYYEEKFWYGQSMC